MVLRLRSLRSPWFFAVFCQAYNLTVYSLQRPKFSVTAQCAFAPHLFGQAVPCKADQEPFTLRGCPLGECKAPEPRQVGGRLGEGWDGWMYGRDGMGWDGWMGVKITGGWQLVLLELLGTEERKQYDNKWGMNIQQMTKSYLFLLDWCI